MRGAAFAVVIALFGGWSSRAAAADSCVAAYEKAQEEKVDGRLRAARAQLHACVQASCPAFVRADCVKWLEEVDAAIPTVVFIARMDGRDVMDVEVRLAGGEELAAQLDGRSVRVDPGRHAFTFVSSFAHPATVEMLVVEGQKNRVVEATLVPLPIRGSGSMPLVGAGASADGGPAPGGWQWLRRHRLPLALAGVGAVGLGGFVVFGASGTAQQERLEKGCAPSCAEKDVSSVRTKYLLADVSLGFGIGALATAAYFFYRNATSTGGSTNDPGGLGWSMAAAPNAAALFLGTGF